MRIITLIVRHGTDKYGDVIGRFQALFARTLPNVHHRILIADNALPVGYVGIDKELGVEVIGASNGSWEFSAWNSAVEYIGGDLHSYDFVHLVTSAFDQLYTRYLERFNEHMLQLARGRAMAIGHIDYYGEPVSLMGVQCQSWLRTSYVFLPPVEVALLGSLVSIENERLFFSNDSSQPFLNDAPVSQGYRDNILGWLTGDGTGQGTEWHSKFELNNSTMPFFVKKATAIFNEQALSNRLRAQGCAIVDATWLATVSRKRLWAKDGPVPAWQVQVSERDVDAAPLSLRGAE